MMKKLAICLALFAMGACSDSGVEPGDNELVETEPPEDIGLPTWPDRVPREIDFRAHVRPLLVINCTECHNSQDAAKYKGLNLQTKAEAMKVIKPGDPDNSLLIQMLLKDPSHQWAMPPTPDRIWGVRLEILRRWIAEGANWPDGLVLETPDKVENW